jgi:hypothetical protein
MRGRSARGLQLNPGLRELRDPGDFGHVASCLMNVREVVVVSQIRRRVKELRGFSDPHLMGFLELLSG